jgi:hypothetical protein
MCCGRGNGARNADGQAVHRRSGSLARRNGRPKLATEPLTKKNPRIVRAVQARRARVS